MLSVLLKQLVYLYVSVLKHYTGTRLCGGECIFLQALSLYTQNDTRQEGTT